MFKAITNGYRLDFSDLEQSPKMKAADKRKREIEKMESKMEKELEKMKQRHEKNKKKVFLDGDSE